jgi:hypothetical protein
MPFLDANQRGALNDPLGPVMSGGDGRRSRLEYLRFDDGSPGIQPVKIPQEQVQLTSLALVISKNVMVYPKLYSPSRQDLDERGGFMGSNGI